MGKRRVRLALALSAAISAIFLLVAGPSRLSGPTPFNHFALLADAFVHGRLDLGGPPPAHAQGNDFALFAGRWFVVFPPFPALLLVPLALALGSPERIPDGLVFIALAGLAPGALFLALERLRDAGRSDRDERTNLILAALFGLGTPFFFSAERGTVWFAAHVVGAICAALFLLFSVEAEHPLLAGLALAGGLATRTPLAFAAPYFVWEAWRADRTLAPRRLASFSIPIALALAALGWLNHARFGAWTEFGYRYLTVVWRDRIDRVGLFSYRYLARNLGVMLTSLPFPGDGKAPFRISPHGLALWVTTPIYLWLARPARTDAAWRALALTALAVAIPSLLYQNSGQLQFGYRFSNDYAPFLFALLAVSNVRFSRVFWAAAGLAVVVNAFGAVTFQRPGFERFYELERGYALYPED